MTEPTATNPTLCTGSSSAETSPQQVTLDPGAVLFQPTNNPSTALYVDTRGAVLLQTARVCTYNPANPNQSLAMRAILDIGSQRSYATGRVAKALGLTPIGKQKLSITTFGSDSQTAQTYDLVKIGVKTSEGDDGIDQSAIYMPSLDLPIS